MNRDLTEYNEWSSSQDSALTNLKRNLGPFQLIGLIAIFLIAFKVLTDSGINKNYVYITLIGIVVVLFWMTNKKPSLLPIPENVIKIITLSLMKRKIGNEYQSGTQIITLPFCKLRQWGTPFVHLPVYWKWEVGVRVITPRGLKKDLLVILHPFEGYITGIIDMPSGYSGGESHDIKINTPEAYAPIPVKTEEKV